MKKNKAHHKAESRHKFISSGVRRTTSTIFSCICTFSLMYSLDATADPENRTVHVELKNSTQGPLWPPGELMEENGSFIVVGSLLQDVGGGVVLVPNQAALVSPYTIPPLDPDTGLEDFSNQLGAPYLVERYLDLTPGSLDLEMEIYTLSFGPPQGNFGGGSRIPMEGESLYNLSSVWPCPDLFPSESQRLVYTRPSLPVTRTPIWGFEGDQKIYDPDTGEAIPAAERIVDFRREKPITLKEWLQAEGQLRIKLTQFDQQLGAHTHAEFVFSFSNLLPNGVYSVWVLRPSGDAVDPLSNPNVFVTDQKGRASVTYEVLHPFPDPAADDGSNRMRSLSVVYHSDAQNWGACAELLGPGVEVHNQLKTPGDFPAAIRDFVTR